MNEADTRAELIEPKPIEIPIRVEVGVSTKSDGTWWDVNDVIDERDGYSLGDCGIHEYDAENGLPDGLTDYVLTTLGENSEFDDGEASFVVRITYSDTGTELGRSVSAFTGRDTLKWPFRNTTAEK